MLTSSGIEPSSGLVTETALCWVTRVMSVLASGSLLSTVATPLANSISSGNEGWTRTAMPTSASLTLCRNRSSQALSL